MLRLSAAQVDISGTPFLLLLQFATAGDHTGHADVWSNNQTVEMWADGDCGWVSPTSAPTKPMNQDGGFAISLTYQK